MHLDYLLLNSNLLQFLRINLMSLIISLNKIVTEIIPPKFDAKLQPQLSPFRCIKYAEAAIGDVLQIKVSLKMSKNSKQNICDAVFLLIKLQA